uniref:Pco090816a n=1 Tax=Arundo donax TaxID=35708 RepID=A0A0A9IEK2_ARUDO
MMELWLLMSQVVWNQLQSVLEQRMAMLKLLLKNHWMERTYHTGLLCK